LKKQPNKYPSNLQDVLQTFSKERDCSINPYYQFISEESNGDIEMIMTYNHKIEVSKLVQQWMPLISVVNDSDDAQKVIERIKKNYGEFLDEL
jgi:hypothetical protein